LAVSPPLQGTTVILMAHIAALMSHIDAKKQKWTIYYAKLSASFFLVLQFIFPGSQILMILTSF
jgi:predicted benzoate:H+ symporter BenE